MSAISSTWPEPAHRQRLRRPFPPVVAGTVEPALHLVLALGVGPADVEAVDPDPVPAGGRGRRCGSARPAPPSRPTYGARYGCPPCADDGDDVDDRARRRRAPSCRATAACMRKNGARRLIAMCCVEQLRRGVEQRAARGQPGRVDQRVDPAVRRDHRGHDGLRPAPTSATSARTNSAAAPLSRSSRDQLLAAPRGRRPVTATVAPSAAAARATPAPTPWVPPLTSTHPVVEQAHQSVLRAGAPSARSAPRRSRAGVPALASAWRTRSAWVGGASPSTGGSRSRLVGNA